MTNIVCYMGGCCGDLIAAMIDATDVSLTHHTVRLPEERRKLKKPHLFASDQEKDDYIAHCEKFGSIVSHDADYHIKNNHKFITVRVTDKEHAAWAAKRFQHLHKPHVWEEMSKFSGVSTTEQYAQLILDYSSWIEQHAFASIDLADIVNGNLIPALQNLGIAGNDNFYRHWIAVQYFKAAQSTALLKRGFVVGA